MCDFYVDCRFCHVDLIATPHRQRDTTRRSSCVELYRVGRCELAISQSWNRISWSRKGPIGQPGQQFRVRSWTGEPRQCDTGLKLLWGLISQCRLRRVASCTAAACNKNYCYFVCSIMQLWTCHACFVVRNSLYCVWNSRQDILTFITFRFNGGQGRVVKLKTSGTTGHGK